MKLGHLKPSDIQITKLNPRKQIDTKSEEFTQLVDDIRTHGLLSPISVNNIEGKLYLICGERRLTACQKLLEELPTITIPAQIYDNLDELEVMNMMVAENIHRKDLDPFEEAEYYKMTLNVAENWQEASTKLNKPVKYIRQRLSLLNLIKPLRKMYNNKQIDINTCLFLARYPNHIQKEAFDDLHEHKNPKVTYGISEFENSVEQNTASLSDINFGLGVTTLLPKGKIAPADCCNLCPMNTGADLMLFDDIGKNKAGHCLKPECLNHKKGLAYLKKLEEACNDETVVLIKNSYTERSYIRPFESQIKEIISKSGKSVYDQHVDFKTDDKSTVKGFDITGYSNELIPVKLLTKKLSVKEKSNKSVELTKDDKKIMKKEITDKITRTEELYNEKVFEFIKENFNRENMPNIDSVENHNLLRMLCAISNDHGKAYGFLSKSDFEIFEEANATESDLLKGLRPVIWLYCKIIMGHTNSIKTKPGESLYEVVKTIATPEFLNKLVAFEKETRESYDKKKERLNERIKELK